MQYRNFVGETNSIALANIQQNRKVLEQAYEECSKLYWQKVALAHSVASTVFYEVYDWYDERKLIHGFTRRAFNGCEKDFKKYDTFLETHMERRARNLLADFHTQIYGGLEKELRDLALTFKFYYERHGVADVEQKVMVTTANAMISMAADLWHEYFDMFKAKYHVDFSHDFMFGNLDVADHLFNQFAEDVCKCGKLGLHPTKNYASVQAFNALCDKMVNQDMLDDKSLVALKFNHYDDEVAEIEREKIGIDKLVEKYSKN